MKGGRHEYAERRSWVMLPAEHPEGVRFAPHGGDRGWHQ